MRQSNLALVVAAVAVALAMAALLTSGEDPEFEAQRLELEAVGSTGGYQDAPPLAVEPGDVSPGDS